MAQLIFEPIEKEISGVWMGLSDIDGATHFQGIAIVKVFFNICLSKYVEQWNLHPSILSTISFKTFSGSFLRRGTEILKDLYTI